MNVRQLVNQMRRCLFALVLAAVASPAAAQPAPWSPERITAGWVFTPSIALGVLWDTNPTTQNEGNPRTSELVGLVNPRSEIDFNGRRAKFSAGYSGTLERYRELDELTRYDQRGRLDARYQMTPRLVFHTRHQVTLTPTTDQLELEGLPFTRVGSRMVTSSGGFGFDISPRVTAKTDYIFQWVDFDRGTTGQADFRFLQGGHAHSPSAEVEYALSRRLKVGSLYTYRHTVIDAGEEVFGTHRAQGTVQYELGPRTSIRGRAGFDHLALVDTTETKTGPSYGAGITQRIRQASIDGSFERAFVPSFGFGGLTASRVFRAGVNVPFAQGRAFVSGGFTYRRTDPVVLRDILVQLDSYWTQGTVGYSIARWLRAEGFISVNHQFSSAQGNVERTRAGIQFVTSKPVRIE
jgi:uncharacterized protein (PEP-CTERM system associated)